MRKKIFILLAFCILATAKTQIVFCPPGAEWHYVFLEDNLDQTPYYKNEMIKYIGDSVVAGETVKVLRHRKLFASINEISLLQTFIKQKGDTIFMKNIATNSQWRILFNYAALPGQSWQIPLSIYNNMTYTVTVDSIKTVSLNGFNLKQLFLTYKQGSVATYHSSIIERIGGADGYFFFNFFGNMQTDGDYVIDFLCYRDNSFGLKQFTSKPCDYELAVGLNEEINKKSVLLVSPNPVNNTLRLELLYPNSEKSYKLNISDISGKIVLQQDNLRETHSWNIETNSLENGIYFLQVFEKETLIATKKIIKE